MTIRSITTDTEALTVTIVADFPVPVHRLWDAYQDPRQLEAFWGPLGWPATFTRHGMYPGGKSAYHMTGPDGKQSAGYWDILRVDPPYEFELIEDRKSTRLNSSSVAISYA